MTWRTLLIAVVPVLMVACQTTTTGMHTIPVTRDYAQLKAPDFKEVVETLEKAQRVGAQHFAPYEYYSSLHYLDLAQAMKGERDGKGFDDYAGLAKSMAEAALRKSTGIEDRGPMAMPESAEACQTEFERLKGQYQELDREKAIEVSPILYAQLNAALSLAEHQLLQGEWKMAAEALKTVEPDMTTILAQDVDEDGVPDMEDGAPMKAEDVDRFEDEDGVPDLDNDGDGVPDVADGNPDEAETKNKWHDFDGVPDEEAQLEAISFLSAHAALSADAQGYLRGVKLLLTEWPDLKLRIEGVAGASKSETVNLDTARQCAEKVQAYLLEQKVAPSQLIVTFQSDDSVTSAPKVRLVLE